MSFRVKKIWIFLLWLLIIISGPISISQNISFSRIFQDQIYLLKVIQRAAGLLGFSLLFCQIILGALMQKWITFLGPKIFRVHQTQGILGYGFVLIHLVSQYLVLFSLSGFTNFWKFTNPWVNLGRVAFILLSLGVLAAYYRTKPLFQKNWRLFHILNYFVFFLVAIHAGRIGTDVRTFPFSFVYWLALMLAGITLLYRFVWSPLKERANMEL